MMKRRLLVAVFLLFAILATVAGAQATGRRQSCVVYTVGIMRVAITTPEVCVPCIMGQPLCAPAGAAASFSDRH
jgi:hypothetical protein